MRAPSGFWKRAAATRSAVPPVTSASSVRSPDWVRTTVVAAAMPRSAPASTPSPEPRVGSVTSPMRRASASV